MIGDLDQSENRVVHVITGGETIHSVYPVVSMLNHV